ncbi:DUF4202 domain-containing protein [Cellulophaga sp. E16_2]|uniref:Glutamyl-tRNA synthetase n=1 Tax=Cellulophaga algicola (strain DSM 14237 / IC166 / ACAM 630) TaxID=688270 RepID=E6X8T5_CELAD|nr:MULTISPECIES: DUF4202 domain-containing protein [Cellulophaga]ADV48680.1 hypothetical protein Celal_1366 [Cellulophaga algicola DSM 14237]MBO0591134.1 DUF4202 domain-containing protein [Cellulophaga sp. E16_2]
MASSDKLEKAFILFDKANEQDPNKEIFEGKEYAKEVLYAIRMTEKLTSFAPNASEVLQLTARCQHICRWEIARDSYEMNRTGYLTWRQDLKKFHAKKAGELLESIGYDQETIDNVAFLLEKKQLKKNEETQILEDVICLVFLEYYFEPFAQKYSEEKLIDILQKTWRKMSKEGQEAALKLPLSANSLTLVGKALQG